MARNPPNNSTTGTIRRRISASRPDLTIKDDFLSFFFEDVGGDGMVVVSSSAFNTEEEPAKAGIALADILAGKLESDATKTFPEDIVVLSL